MTNSKRAHYELFKLLSELEFKNLEERYPKIHQLILTKLTEDEIGKERIRYAIDNELNAQIKELKERIGELQKLRVDQCPSCGCNELLCGHPKQCTSED